MSLVIMTIKKLTLMSILTAIALIIFIVEAQIPIPIPIPGVKLGLANVVILFALFYNTKRDKKTIPYLTTVNVFAILICRIILGAIFTGRPIVLVYSLAGGLLAFAAQVPYIYILLSMLVISGCHASTISMSEGLVFFPLMLQFCNIFLWTVANMCAVFSACEPLNLIPVLCDFLTSGLGAILVHY